MKLVRESLNEKFGADKIAYYRFYRSGSDFTLIIVGDTFGLKDILKKYRLEWSYPDYGWKSKDKLSQKEWEEISPKLFKEIEDTGYKVQLHGKKLSFKPWNLGFTIKGYEKEDYPSIPDGDGAKVIIKQWHHYAPMTGITGKGSRMIKDLLKYCGYNWSGYVWEKIYLSNEVNDLIKYLEENNYTIDDQRKKLTII